MELARYILKKLVYGIPLFLGVTSISFLLMVYFGSDVTYALLGKNATQSDLDNIRHQLGYNLSVFQRYIYYLGEVLRCDFGHSSLNQEKISDIFARAIPISIAVNLPGFVIGNALAILLSLLAAYHRGQWQDKIVMVASSIGMSMSFLIVIIGCQVVLCSSRGLNLFPVQGWEMGTVSSYLSHIFVPTLATIFVSLGYNMRFFRAIMVEETKKSYVRSAFSFGWPPHRVMFKAVLRNSLVPILTRLIFSIPFIFVEGSLLIESFFGIPGMGGVTYNAIVSGDLPILKAVVSIGTVLYVVILVLADVVYKIVDPRVTLT